MISKLRPSLPTNTSKQLQTRTKTPWGNHWTLFLSLIKPFKSRILQEKILRYLSKPATNNSVNCTLRVQMWVWDSLWLWWQSLSRFQVIYLNQNFPGWMAITITRRKIWRGLWSACLTNWKPRLAPCIKLSIRIQNQISVKKQT